MAILTASGRAALAAAIKQQTLHLARGMASSLNRQVIEIDRAIAPIA